MRSFCGSISLDLGHLTCRPLMQSGGVLGGRDPPAFTKGRKKAEAEAARRQVCLLTAAPTARAGYDCQTEYRYCCA
jgi:hypothetical protein